MPLSSGPTLPPDTAVGGRDLPSPHDAPAIAGTAHSPHLGTLDVYQVAPGGAITEDPSVAEDSLSLQPIQNVYETLVSYDGPSTSSFVPTLAICVPGTPQCIADYGTSLIADATSGPLAGQPVYWTFVLDPNAQFRDPTTGAHWSVYPTDVMFSVLRTMAFADLPFVGADNGWTITQALLPLAAPNPSDIHTPYVNTPADELNSMLINDTTYCPAAAITNAHGCITFVANGSDRAWPSFLDFVADGLGASVEPCGWFTYDTAGIPGWTVTGAAVLNGDGSCLLPDGDTTTESSAWASYVSGLAPTYWDAFEESALATPSVQPAVRWSMVGSGPYMATIVPGTGYELVANPAYAQPSACNSTEAAALGLPPEGVYTSAWCDPAPAGYLSTVDVFWEPNDAFGISQSEAGTADFAQIEPGHTSTLLELAALGKLDYYILPTMSSFFMPMNLNWNPTNYAADFPPEPMPNIPRDFFSGIGLRQFLVHAYPYATTEATTWTVDGIQWLQGAGGPIPPALSTYYPADVSFPTGNPDANPTDVGGAAWWWAQATNPTSPYYDAELASCTKSTPCTWAIAGAQGDPTEDIGIADWIASIDALTNGALQPFGGSSLDMTLPDSVTLQVDQASGNGPLPTWASGWTGSYADPEAYIAPMTYPNDTYASSDAVAEQLALPAYNSASCGHASGSSADLSYWASVGEIHEECQGVAYDSAVTWAHQAASGTSQSQRISEYDLVDKVLNELALYLWVGQPSDVITTAPWIDGATIDANPLLGGYNDPLWFQIRYTLPESQVTFHPEGLPNGTSWSVTFDNVTKSGTGDITFTSVPSGVFSFAVGTLTEYYANPPSGTITVSGSDVTEPITFTFLYQATVTTPVGVNPQGVVYDPAVEQVYIANAGSDTLTVLDATSASEISGSPVSLSDFDGLGHALSPVALAVDGSGNVWVAGLSSAGGAGMVRVTGTVMNPATAFGLPLTNVTSIALTASLAFIEGNHSGGPTVVVYCDPTSCAAPSTTVLEPGTPGGLAVDGSGAVWAAGTSTVPSSMGELWTGLTTGTPTSFTLPDLSSATNVTLDPENGYLYVGGTCSGFPACRAGDAGIDVVNPSALKEVTQIDTGVAVVAGAGIGGITYDPWNGYVDAAYSDGASPPASGLVLIDTSTNDLVGLVPLTGLPTGVAATAAPVPNNVFVALDPPASGSVAMVSHTYPVVFSESGLGSGLTFGVTLASYYGSLTAVPGSTNALAFFKAKNAYDYSVAAVEDYAVTPSSGTVTVVASEVTVNVTFVQTVHAVTLTENGLPTNAVWTVGLNGTTERSAIDSMTFYEPNGSIPCLILGSPGHVASSGCSNGFWGSLNVAGETNVTVLFAPAKKLIGFTFHESGLIAGESWCSLLGVHAATTYYPLKECSTTATIHIANVPGSPSLLYAFDVPTIPGYNATAASGGHPISLIGTLVGTKGATVNVKFAPILYPVTFDQTGLTTTTWHLKAACTVPKREKRSCYGMVASKGLKGPGITLMLRNGTYTWTITPIHGYGLQVNGTDEWSGTLTVNGTGVTVSVTFVPDPPGAGVPVRGSLGLPPPMARED